MKSVSKMAGGLGGPQGGKKRRGGQPNARQQVKALRQLQQSGGLPGGGLGGFPGLSPAPKDDR
jgi:hypothetical protein